MSRETLLIVLGALVLVAPFSGLPMSWLMVLLPVCGSVTLGIGVSLRARRSRAATSSHEASLSVSS